MFTALIIRYVMSAGDLICIGFTARTTGVAWWNCTALITPVVLRVLWFLDANTTKKTLNHLTAFKKPIIWRKSLFASMLIVGANNFAVWIMFSICTHVGANTVFFASNCYGGRTFWIRENVKKTLKMDMHSSSRGSNQFHNCWGSLYYFQTLGQG